MGEQIGKLVPLTSDSVTFQLRILTTILTLAWIFCIARFWTTGPPSVLYLGITRVTATKSVRIALTTVSMSKFRWYLYPSNVSTTIFEQFVVTKSWL